MKKLIALSVLLACTVDPPPRVSLCEESVLSEDPDEICERFPWGPAEECPEETTIGKCRDLLGHVAALGCEDVTLCDYNQCQAVMRQAPCGQVPAVCRPLYECLSMAPSKV